ncbi:MAG: metallophosphoesterase [Rhabdochlamydiaceae bacterium]|nr:metallophosphoesterase [Rhabdochlamydiaceae bacterium]
MKVLRMWLLWLVFFWGNVGEAVPIVYLTWIHDPSTTMVVQWHSSKDKDASEVLFREVGETEWQRAHGFYVRLPKTSVLVHTVELGGLRPGGEYEFQVEDEVCRFRTLPLTLERPVRFVMGGDAYLYEKLFRKMNRQIAAQDPDFVVVGGDIAYTHGKPGLLRGKSWQLNRWQTFLKEWKKMVTSDGRLIPLLAVLGNHDVRSGDLNPFSYRTLFYELFALPEKGRPFRTLDCGNYLSLFLLDTGHSYHIEGTQTEWLKRVLAERENKPYKMAAYHIGAYPSVYPFDGDVPREIRSLWCPLFERYHLTAAFEHHNHAYKRTVRIKDNALDPQGVLYMGDGSWGVSPRKVKNRGEWFLERAEKVNAVCLITLDRAHGAIEALSNQGVIIDEVMVLPGTAQVAVNERRWLLQ